MMSVRISRKEDGKIISELLYESGWNVQGLNINWEQVHPFWLVCEDEGKIIGCVQICLSKPFGYLEMMSVRRDLNKRNRALAFKSLFYGGCGTIKGSGAVAVSAMIAHEDRSWKKILERRGSVNINSGSRLIKSLV